MDTGRSSSGLAGRRNLAVESHLAVLLEVKPKGIALGGNQLERHAIAWGLDPADLRAWRPGNESPPGFGFSTWRSLAEWIAGELDDTAATNAERQTLTSLLEFLASDEVEVISDAPVLEAPAEGRPVLPTALPASTPVAEILRGWDVGEVVERASARFGPGVQGSHIVQGTDVDCARDAKFESRRPPSENPCRPRVQRLTRRCLPARDSSATGTRLKRDTMSRRAVSPA